jgi:hypothetical protein
MGTRDEFGNAIDETRKGNCVFDPFSSILHFIFDVVPYLSDEDGYNELHCCMRKKGVASGNQGGTSSALARRAKRECKQEISMVRRMGFAPSYCRSSSPPPAPLYIFEYTVIDKPRPNPYD